MEKDNQEYKPLTYDDSQSSGSLDVDDNQSDESLHFVRRRSKRSRIWILRILEGLIVVASLAFGIFGSIKFSFGESSSSSACPMEPFFRSETDHLNSALAWTHHITGSGSIAYMGEPTMESNAAWKELLKDRAITLTTAELDILNKTGTIPSLAGELTGDGTDLGYKLMSGVDYELYCLSLIRQWSYWDFYQTSMVELPEVYYSSPEDAHSLVDSCIESLRLQILCSSNSMRFLVPNATAITGYRTPIVLKSEESRWQCARSV